MAAEFRTVDLFAGAGGFSLAAQLSGFAIEFAVELDRWAAETYKRNFVDTASPELVTIYNKDINDLSPVDLKVKHFPADKRCDLLLGGPPCQGFSTHRINDAGVDDPRNALILRYFEFVKALKPRVFLMENVPGILWDRHKHYLDSFYSSGRAAGYHVFPAVTIDARNYGLPQRRKRVFVLGVETALALEGFQWPPAPTHASPSVRAKKPELLPWESCANAFNLAAPGDENDVHMKHTVALTNQFANTPHDGGSRIHSGVTKPCHKNHNGHKDVYGRIDRSRPAPTMTTACINPSKGRFVHPTKDHGITAREAARIQTFPETFKFAGGLTAAGKQIGNAVPVELGVALLKHINAFLKKTDQEIAEAVVPEANPAMDQRPVHA
jgi:DNA (cytosine-5)-methyltransferase 1